MFMQLLHHCWGEDADFQQKVDALQEALAATMFGVAPMYERVFCLKGAAKTGKTRVLRIVEGLMPLDCMSCVHPSEWNDKFLPAEMFGKLLNFCGEISESRYIEGANFKEIVEGAAIQAQRKNGQPFKFSPKCAQWFAGNHDPKSRDTSDGFIRRWLFLEFMNVVSDEKKVVDIDKIILQEEREHIAAWAVQGLPRLIRNRSYTLPASHKRTADSLANQINPVRRFMATCPRLRVGQPAHEGIAKTFTTEAELLSRYELFSISTRGKPVGRQTFHNLMAQLQHEFGIKQVIRNAAAGGEETIYEWVTVRSDSDAFSVAA